MCGGRLTVTGLITRPVYVAAQDAEDLSAGLRGVSSDIGAVLIRTDPAHYSAGNESTPVGRSERPVVTDEAMAAAAATAALLTSLNRRGLSPERSRCTRELAEAASEHPQLIIITPDQTSWTRPALPSLPTPPRQLKIPKSALRITHTCALALAAATPPDRLLPDPMEPALASRSSRPVPAHRPYPVLR